MRSVYSRTDGLLVAPVGHLWAIFSPTSGETALINDESAAILEVLESGPSGTSGVCAALAKDSSLDAARLNSVVDEAWPRLVESGLVIELRDALSKLK